MSDMLYVFETCIVYQELNYQKRIEYENVGSDFLAFTYAHTTLLRFYAAGIPDDIFRVALANEIWIRLGKLPIADKRWLVGSFSERIKAHKEGKIEKIEYLWKDDERAGNLASELIDPSIETIIRNKDYFSSIRDSFDNLMIDTANKYKRTIMCSKRRWN